jgi:Leucine-rich repeat (LRR) protein
MFNFKFNIFIIVFLLSSSIHGQTDLTPPQQKCVFVGCSCGDDADQLVASSKEQYDNEDVSPSAENAVSPQSLSYDITCKDENNPNFKFKDFPSRDFSRRYSHQITTLEIAQNELRYIPADRFDKLEISMADFSRNQISSLSDHAFRGIIKLELLDLSDNQLENLNENVFEPVKFTLIHLKLNHNKLNKMNAKDLSKVLSSLSALKSLAIRHNFLTELPNLSKVAKLEDLSLSSNQIEQLTDPNTNENLLPNTLIELNLEHNRIKHINDDTFSHLKHLKYLNLESNQITTISDASFAHLTRLIHLNLGKNFIKQIPTKIFYTLINLERVDLSAQNQMLKIIDDYSFDRQSNSRPIKKIDLSKNRITKISNKAFCSMNESSPYSNIREIDLANNPLQNVNSCILRQLSKGLSEQSSGSSGSLHHHKSRLSFKPTHFAEKLTPSLKCDCEITRSSHYVDLEGECENNAGVLVPLKQFKCNNNDLNTFDEVETNCASMVEFDCSQTDDSSKSKTDSGSDNNNNRLPIIDNNSNNKNNANKNNKNQEQSTSQRDKSSITKQPNSSLENNANKQLSSINLVMFLSIISSSSFLYISSAIYH